MNDCQLHLSPINFPNSDKGQKACLDIHVIFSWAEIGRSDLGRLRSQIGRYFHGKKYSIVVSKIVICSTIGHRIKKKKKQFYLPAYG